MKLNLIHVQMQQVWSYRMDRTKQREGMSHREVQAAVERCTALLHSQFGANRVIPFGSVLTPEKWHAGSDLDLAVEGIPPEQFFRAWASLRTVLPSNLEVDLVALEDAPAALRARILQEVEMTEDPHQMLHSLVEDELAALQRLVEQTEEAVSNLDVPPSQFEMNALASYVHQFYTGCERILERIAIEIDGGLAQGAFSHANLLAQMAQQRPGLRPPIIDEDLWLRLQEYLQFRHFFRHAYAYILEWPKLHPLVSGMSETLMELQVQLERFFDELIR